MWSNCSPSHALISSACPQLTYSTVDWGCPCRKSNSNELEMQSAEVRCCDDSTYGQNFPGNRRVLVQRQMGAGLVVIRHVRAMYVPEGDARQAQRHDHVSPA